MKYIDVWFTPANKFFPPKWYVRPKRISASFRPYRIYRWMGIMIRIGEFK